jgi:hypothetical protein
MNGEPLRVGVVVESGKVPAWVAWAVAEIASGDACDLAFVALRGGAPVPRRPMGSRWADGLAHRLYERLDARIFGRPGATRAVHLPPDATGRPEAAVVDVVVSFVPRDPKTWDGPPPPHGVWAVVPMDDGRPTSAPSRFWDVRRRRDVATTSLVALAEGNQRVIAECTTPVDPLSVARTRNLAAWAGARLVVRSLRAARLRSGGESLPSGPDEMPGPPTAAETLAHGARTAWRGLRAKGRTLGFRGEWFVAVRAQSAEGAVGGPPLALPNPHGRYLADPFPIERDGRHYLFVEDYSIAARRAAISVCELRPSGLVGPLRRVLERPYHLSYPFVFEHTGAVYMIPETGEAGRIELYRALEFPDRWTLERVLLDGVTAFDATLHAADGLLWLFACVPCAPDDVGELHLYWSESLHGEWRPHPENPVVADPGRARPAGRLFMRGDELLRPGQDCARRYGEAVVLNRVDALSTVEYRETPVSRIEPSWAHGLERTHTYTFDSGYECFDGYRRVSRPRLRGRG